MPWRRNVDDVAIEIWVLLGRAGERGRTRRELMNELKITASQCRAGIGRINHVIQADRGQPIAIRREGPGYYYVLPEHYSDFVPWAMELQKHLLTRARTETKRWRAAADKWPDSPAARLARKTLSRVEEDVADLARELALAE